MRPISFETVLQKPPKKIPKNSKHFFKFKVIAINCSTLVGAIFQLMHGSQKISNRNSLQFHCYRYLNVTYSCLSVPLQLHFQLRKRKIVGWTQIRRVRGQLSFLCEWLSVPVVFLSMHAAQIVHTVFIFSNHQIECSEWWFPIFVLSAISYH